MAMRTCARCGREMQQQVGEAEEQYARRRFCSSVCKRRGILRAETLVRCECGAPATHLARFQQLSSEMHVQLAELPVCESCGGEMIREDKGVTLEPLTFQPLRVSLEVQPAAE